MLRLSAASLCLLAKRSMSVVVDEACAPRLRLALVRHGESMNNIHEAVSEAAYVANRHADPDLSPRGYRQADALGGFLANATRSAFLGVHRVEDRPQLLPRSLPLVARRRGGSAEAAVGEDVGPAAAAGAAPVELQRADAVAARVVGFRRLQTHGRRSRSRRGVQRRGFEREIGGMHAAAGVLTSMCYSTCVAFEMGQPF